MGPNPTQFFVAPPEISTWTLHSEVEGEAKMTATVRSDGEVDIDGRSFTRLRGAEDDEDENLSVSVRYDGDFFEVGKPEITDIDGLGDVEMQSDPIRVPMNPPVGEEQPVEVEHWEITIDEQTFTQSLTGSYSRLDEAATVETPQGEIGACRHYRIDGSADEVAGLPVDLV